MSEGLRRNIRIIMVNPPSPDNRRIIRLIDCSHEAKANYLWQPNDFMIITSRLNPEDEVILVDGTCDGLSGEEFLNALRPLRGDLMVFALSSVCWSSDLAAFKKTKALFPGIPLYVLGDIFLERYYREQILHDCNGIIFHPYLLDIDRMASIRETPGAVLPGVCTAADAEVFSPRKQITFVSSNVTRHEVFLKRGYLFPFARHFRFATVTTMWGCPFACSYCTDSKIPPVIRRHEDVLRELDTLKRLDVKELFMADKTFGFYHQESYPLLQEMAKRHHFSWSCYFHPQTYNADLLQLMSEAGCHTIIIGIDSANIGSLRQYGRNVEVQKLDNLLTHANSLGMNICADFILGLEHESEEDIIRTLEYSLQLPIDFASFNIAAPLPGSDIRANALRDGTLMLGQEGFDTMGHSGILGNKKINHEKIMKLRKNAVRRFYLRPSYLIKRLRRTTSLEHFRIQFGEMLYLFRKQI